MENFIWPTVGGCLIGLAAVLMMYSLGKIAGISGIFWGALTGFKQLNSNLWQCLFILGLPLGAIIFHLATNTPFPPVPDTPMMAAIAGLLVGFGVRLGNGCTSGHGVCGIGRFSTRSIAATLIFMATGIITVALMH